jgi:hypothetical protein
MPLLPAIRQTLGRIANLIIIDASAGTPATFVAYFRSWLAEGMRLVASSTADWRDADNWVGNDTRLLLILAQGKPLSNSLQDLVNRLDADHFRVVGVDPATGEVVPLLEQYADYVDARLAAADQNSLEVSGSRPRSFPRFSLPMKLGISSLHADPFSAQFAIAAKGPDLPNGQRVWFRLDPGFKGILTIDRDVNFSGDTWRLEVVRDGGAPATRLVQSEPLQEPEASPLNAVAVILDRTCPDNASWEKAFNLTTSETVTDAFRHEESPEGYNADVIRGLREGFRRAFDLDLLRELRPWWCRDLPGNGVSNFIRDMPLEAYNDEIGSARMISSAVDCEELLATAGYSPGLDLWDPVEVALNRAYASLKQATADRRAILIVGNSPPSHPTQDSPLRSLAILPGASKPCTIRRQSPAWHDTLARCAEAQIPVVYLFLRHTSFGTVRPTVIELYEQMQSRVETALSGTVRLLGATASADNIRDGIVTAFRDLHALATVTSRVEFEEKRAP